MYNGQEVKVVEDYTYLGVIFNYNGTFKKALENQKAVGLRAMQALLSKIRILSLDVDTSMELFHRCVMPILLYGSEIWAYDSANLASLEVFYRGFFETNSPSLQSDTYMHGARRDGTTKVERPSLSTPTRLLGQIGQ